MTDLDHADFQTHEQWELIVGDTTAFEVFVADDNGVAENFAAASDIVIEIRDGGRTAPLIARWTLATGEVRRTSDERFEIHQTQAQAEALIPGTFLVGFVAYLPTGRFEAEADTIRIVDTQVGG